MLNILCDVIHDVVIHDVIDKHVCLTDMTDPAIRQFRKRLPSIIVLKRFIQLVQSITQKLLTLHNWKYVENKNKYYELMNSDQIRLIISLCLI